MRNTGKLSIAFLSALLWCMPLAVNAAVLYSSNYIGDSFPQASTEHYVIAPFGATASQIQGAQDAGYWAATGDVKNAVVKRLSGTACSGTQLQLFTTPSPFNTYTSNNGVASGNYCTYAFTSSFAPTGAHIQVMYITPIGGQNIVLDGSGNNSGNSYDGTNSNPITGTPAFLLCDAGGCGTPSFVAFSSVTRIISTTPASGSTIATSTAATFGATGFINSADYSSGMYLEIKYAAYSASQAAVANIGSLYTTLDIPITAAGSFNYSTTSPVSTVGQYTMQTQIRSSSWINSALNFFGFGQFANLGITTATTTTFIAAHSSAYDILIASTTESINNYLASSTVSIASCTNWTSFSLGDCMNLLFVPQTQPIYTALDDFKNQFLTYAPWGYLTRFIVIMTGSATTSLPVMSVTFPLGSATDLDTYTLDMGDMITGGASLLNSIPERGGSMNAQDIIEPWIQLFIALFVVIIIVRDLTKMGGGGAHNFNSAKSRGQV